MFVKENYASAYRGSSLLYKEVKVEKISNNSFNLQMPEHMLVGDVMYLHNGVDSYSLCERYVVEIAENQSKHCYSGTQMLVIKKCKGK